MIAAVDALPAPETATTPLAPETTVELVDRARRGDVGALDRLIDRCMPPLRRWAHGRLPASLRGPQETADLVQNAIMATLRRLEVVELRHHGALQAYLRTAIANQIRDLVREQQRRPVMSGLTETIAGNDPSPLECAIGAESVERYEAAMRRLSPADREAVMGRLEFHYSYEELAVALAKPSADAARMAVTRAVKRLAEEMRRG